MTRRVDTEADLGEVRHAIDLEKLGNYLVSQQPDNFAAPFQIKQFGFGQSNPSYQITDAKNRKFVLRKQPPGQLLSKSAHRVDREFYMQQALYKNTKVPVAKMYLLCTDHSIIGTDFYVMEFLNGRIFHDVSIEGVSATDRRALWDAVIETLALLHEVNPAKIGLPPNMTRNLSSHYPRQATTLKAIADAQAKAKDKKTGEQLGPIPDVEKIFSWMQKHIPSERVAIVHGDFKVDNIVFHATENRVIGILDWELCTIGHPLADLGNLLQAYSLPQPQPKGILSIDPSTPGLPTLDDLLGLYARLTGYDPRPDWPFAVVYAHVRLAVITHGIAARNLQGQASSAQASKYGKMYATLAQFAVDAIDKGHSQSKL